MRRRDSPLRRDIQRYPFRVGSRKIRFEFDGFGEVGEGTVVVAFAHLREVTTDINIRISLRVHVPIAAGRSVAHPSSAIP